MKDFANLAAAGARLAEDVRPRLDSWVKPALVPVMPNGVPVVAGMPNQLDLPVVALEVTRSPDGVIVPTCPPVEGATAIVIDDGVETGTVARAVAPALRASGAAALVLAVPVCSREAMADLRLLYDDLIVVVTPLVRRSLAWHYDLFDTVDEQEARRILRSLGT